MTFKNYDDENTFFALQDVHPYWGLRIPLSELSLSSKALDIFNQASNSEIDSKICSLIENKKLVYVGIKGNRIDKKENIIKLSKKINRIVDKYNVIKCVVSPYIMDLSEITNNPQSIYGTYLLFEDNKFYKNEINPKGWHLFKRKLLKLLRIL